MFRGFLCSQQIFEKQRSGLRLSFPCAAHCLQYDDEQLEHGNKIGQFKARGVKLTCKIIKNFN